MKLLVITPYPPFAPGGDGATTRVYNQLKILSRYMDLYIIVYVRKQFEENLEQIKDFNRHCAALEIITESDLPSSKKVQGVWNSITRKPRQITMCDAAKEAIKDRLKKWESRYVFDAVQIEHSFFGTLLKDFDATVRRVVVFMDVITDIARHKYREARDIQSKIDYWLKYHHIKLIEKEVLSYCDAAVVMSNGDKSSLQQIYGVDEVIISPNGVATESFDIPVKTDFDRANILFMGTFTYYPMREGMIYCIEELLPRLRAKLGKEAVQLTFVGPVYEGDRKNYESAQTIFTGRISNVAEYLNKASVCINPIKFGSGTCLKVLEYSASRKATVSTLKGAEGLEMSNGVNIIIAGRDHFDDEIVKLLQSPDKRRKIADGAFNFVSRNYTWGKTTEPLLKYYLPEVVFD